MKQIPEKEFINFIGIQKEDGIDKAQAFTEAIKTFSKLKKILKQETNLTIHIKKHEVEGKRKKYSVHAKIRSPDHFFEASSIKWDFLQGVRDSLKTLEKNVIRKLKN